MNGIELCKELHKAVAKGLKKRAHAKTVQVNYKGTGSQAHRRQLWVRFENGQSVDIWLSGHSEGVCRVQIGGVMARSVNTGVVSAADIEAAVDFVVNQLGDFGALKAAA